MSPSNKFKTGSEEADIHRNTVSTTAIINRNVIIVAIQVISVLQFNELFAIQ